MLSIVLFLSLLLLFKLNQLSNLLLSELLLVWHHVVVVLVGILLLVDVVSDVFVILNVLLTPFYVELILYDFDVVIYHLLVLVIRVNHVLLLRILLHLLVIYN